jgi:hypothetical protein
MERLLEQLSIHSGSRSLINAVTEVWRAPGRHARLTNLCITELVVMSQFETFDPARLVLYMPTCEKCGAKMWLVRIEPDAPGHVVAPHMSAFGGKADMTIGTRPLSWSLLGVKRTWPVAAHMSAYDPKRTLVGIRPLPQLVGRYDVFS